MAKLDIPAILHDRDGQHLRTGDRVLWCGHGTSCLGTVRNDGSVRWDDGAVSERRNHDHWGLYVAKTGRRETMAKPTNTSEHAQDWKSDADRTALRDKIIKSTTAALGAEPETLYPSSIADCDDLSPPPSRGALWNGEKYVAVPDHHEQCPGCGLSYPLKPNEHSIDCQSEEHLAAFPWARDTPKQDGTGASQVATSQVAPSTPQVAPKPTADWTRESPRWFLPRRFEESREEIVDCRPWHHGGGQLFDRANDKWVVVFRNQVILSEFDRVPEHSPAKTVFEAAFYYARAFAGVFGGAYGPILVGNDSAREFGLRFDREYQKDFARRIVKLGREKQREDHVIVEMIRKSIAGPDLEDFVDAFLAGRLG